MNSRLRPCLNVITPTSHAGKALAAYLCGKLTPLQASTQRDLNWAQLAE